jgi:hypothetical protein
MLCSVERGGHYARRIGKDVLISGSWHLKVRSSYLHEGSKDVREKQQDSQYEARVLNPGFPVRRIPVLPPHTVP